MAHRLESLSLSPWLQIEVSASRALVSFSGDSTPNSFFPQASQEADARTEHSPPSILEVYSKPTSSIPAFGHYPNRPNQVLR